jgi:hypothetical protein
VKQPQLETIKHSFGRLDINAKEIMGKAAADLADSTLGVLEGLKHWSYDPRLITHTHTNEYGEERLCHDFTCDLWWWNDPAVKEAIPERFLDWVGHDIERATAAIQIALWERVKLLTGPTMKMPVFRWRVRIFKIIGLLFMLISSGVVGRNI